MRIEDRMFQELRDTSMVTVSNQRSGNLRDVDFMLLEESSVVEDVDQIGQIVALSGFVERDPNSAIFKVPQVYLLLFGSLLYRVQILHDYLQGIEVDLVLDGMACVSEI